MRSTTLIASFAAVASSLSIGRRESQELYTLEIAPGVTKVVTEAEKWALKAEGVNFFDITDFPDFAESRTLVPRLAVTYPSGMTQSAAIKTLLPQLSKTNMRANLVTFSDFHNRYYKADYGRQSSEWLLAQVNAIIKASGAVNATAQAFKHSFVQSSVIATIPGKSAKIVAIGAHQDSINQRSPSTGRAPGADDDGSGTMTILEAFKVLLTDSKIAQGLAENTLEFHWYAAEEGGLLGSQDIFQAYAKAKKDVRAMFQQDMTGYVQATINAGKKPSVGVITDYVDTGLTNFIKLVITEYCSIPYVETKCGYACSDHASASKAGYPSSFVIEAAMEYTSKSIHTDADLISTVDFDHVLEHAKMTTGFAYELAFAANL